MTGPTVAPAGAAGNPPGVVNGWPMALSNYLVAAAQMTSTADRARNVDTALRLVGEAADLGAKLVGLPENFAFMGPEEQRLAGAETLEGPTLGALRELARRRGIFVV